MYPPSKAERRAAYYGQAGTVMAQLAEGIGQPIPSATADQWNSTLYRLSQADDVSEAAPEHFTTQTALEILGLDESNQPLIAALEGLLVADRDSHRARSIAAHFEARSREAVHSTDLLRYQSPEPVAANESVWEQLSRVAVAGIYLDSLMDAQEDSHQLKQFSSKQLALGAAIRLTKISVQIQPKTWRIIARTIHKNEQVSGAIKGKILSLMPAA